jgi:hypothetical protein
MNIPLEVTVSRINSNVSNDVIRITLIDPNACTEFVRVDLNPADFAQAITGLCNVSGDGVVRNLERVGKIMEMDTLEFPMPEYDYDNQKRTAHSQALKVCPKGWIPDSGFSSQNSFFAKDDQRWARTTMRRWV